MTKTFLAVLALVGSSFLVGCAAQATDQEEQGASESLMSRADKKKQLQRAASECPTTEDSVTRSYKIALLRAPDADGFAYWVDAIDSGTQTRIEVLRNLVRSEEFATNNAAIDNAAFVTSLYTSFLGRASDPEGRGYWLGQLDAGVSKTDVALNFVNGDEFRNPNLNNNSACYAD